MKSSLFKIKSKSIKAGIGYTVGNILIKGISFLSVPVFSRIMSQSEFGVYNVFLSYDAILFVIIGLALHSSIRSASLEFEDIDNYVSSILIIYFVNASLILAISYIFRSSIHHAIGYRFQILLLLTVYSLSQALIILYNEVLSLTYAYKKYLMIAASSSIANIVLSLVLILTVYKQDAALGRIIGSTAATALIAVIIVREIIVKSKPLYNKAYWLFGLKYSIPIVPHGISQVLLAQFDRIMIDRMVSSSSAGVYSLAANIKLILTVITTSLSTVWTTWFYDKYKEAQVELIQKRAKSILACFACLSSLLILVSPELILVLGGVKYQAAVYVAVPMVVDAFVLFVYNIIVPVEYYLKKTKYVMYGTMMAAVLNVITNYIFIKKYGFYAAAYTTLFSYIIYLILHILICYRLINRHIIPIKYIALASLVVSLIATLTLVSVKLLMIRIVAGVIVAAIFAVSFKRFMTNYK